MQKLLLQVLLDLILLIITGALDGIVYPDTNLVEIETGKNFSLYFFRTQGYNMANR